MYDRYQIIKKFIRYYFQAHNGKGHGVHSPFVFDFIKHVLNDKGSNEVYERVEARRAYLLRSKKKLQIEDLGAGSAVKPGATRKVRAVAASSLKPKKFAQLLYRMVKYYQPAQVIELGTSLGITTAYLAAACRGQVHTLEGSAEIAAVAEENFLSLGFENITQHKGDFAHTLPPLLDSLKHPAFIFIDGNHRKVPTLQYFSDILTVATESTIIVFDDIHWSKEMEAAWEYIKDHEAVTLSIDLFFIGIVFFRKDFKVKQHFPVRF